MMTNTKRRTRNRRALFALFLFAAVSILFTCAEVPDFCGSGEIYDPSCQFCYGSRAYPLCKNGKYNPLTAGCDKDTLIGTRCSNDSIVPLGTPCGGYSLTLAAAPESGGAVEAVTPPDNNGLTYNAKRPVMLRATAAADYKFFGWAGTQPSQWQDNGSGTVTAEYITSGNIPKITIVAMFKPIGKGRLITDVFPKSPTLGGSVSRDKPQPEDGYTENERVTVTAAPAPGFAFAGWSGADSSKTNPAVVTMDESKTLVAMFTPLSHALTAKASPAEGGAVFINGTPFGGASQDVGARIQVWAKENAGYAFTGWSGSGAAFDDKTSAATMVTLSDGAAITANFKKGAGGGTPGTQALVCSLTVVINPKDGGEASAGGGKYPGGWIYMLGDEAAVTATPKAGYVFAGWSGADSSKDSSVTITMDGNKALTANFRDTAGAVTPPDGGDGDNKCGTDGTDRSCKTTEIGGQTWMAENLNYTPLSGNSWCYNDSNSYCNKYGRLYTWEAAKAACQSMGWRLPDTMEWNRMVETVGGIKEPNSNYWNYAGKALKATSGWGSNSSYNGTDTYGFSALPGGYRYSDGYFGNAGYYGYWWTAAEGGSGSAYDRHMYNDYDYVYEFNDVKSYGFSVRCVKGENTTSPKPTYTLTTDVSPTGSGTVSRSPSQTSYDSGTVVTVTATAASGYTFSGWTGASTSTNNPVTITMNGNRTLTANFTQSGGANTHGDTGSVVDSRDYKLYKTVKIGSQWWMAQNLNYETSSGSWCHSNSTDSCAKYGRLYDWATAMDISTDYNSTKWNGSDVQHQGVCPSGWHLPSNAEWGDLVTAVGSSAGKKLKSTSGWNSYNGASGNGTDSLGFSALPGGSRDSDGDFSYAGDLGYWWTATEYSGGNAYPRLMYSYSDYMYENSGVKSDGFSVRCVKGESTTPPKPTYTLTTNVSPTGGGTVSRSPSLANYDSGAVVTVTATAGSGYTFTGWSGVASGAVNPLTVTMNGDRTLTAIFTKNPETPDVVGGNKCGVDGTADSCKKTGVIGGKVWMAENLNLETGESWCYGNSTANCDKYGRLYTWTAAVSACQSLGGGWWLPDTAEWRRLVEATGGDTAAKNLKATDGWSSSSYNGTDSYGFSALPGGRRYSVDSFDNAGYYGVWWTATELSGGSAYARHMYYDNDYVDEYNVVKSYGFSVRCVKE